MSRHLVLSGGPTHAFADTTAVLVELAAEAGFATEVLDEPDDFIATLRAVEAGTEPPIDLVTVNALRWRMEVDRYADLRAQWAWDLVSDDAAVIDRHVRSGGGLLALHTAVICFDGEPTWAELCGGSWDWDRSSHPRVGDISVDVAAAGHDHPLTSDIEPFTIHDEAYGFLAETPGLEPLLVSTHGGREHPLLWARSVGAGRVVTDLLGHGVESMRHPAHQTVLSRALAWARREVPVGS